MPNRFSRRQLITTAGATVAGVSGLAIGARVASQNGLIPPGYDRLYGPGETLTYASQRLLTRHSLAREFPRSQISAKPFANLGRSAGKEFEAFQKEHPEGFANWKLTIDGLVSKPGSWTLAELMRYPTRSQITQLTCEEGWSFVAEWIGVPLAHMLELAGIQPQARFVAYASIQPGWSDSIDIADALHPQTLVTYAMNGGDLPIGHGGPLRLRVPRQLGYKSVKFLTRLTVTDTLKDHWQPGDYSWFAGI